ncbi:2-hydroxy-6-oxonona-2,4-dienedioate hydrolase/4,5:9,10-diseco-3-hydroxy-5,9,17-trioxoandrosta-1(10),2-diene-4-oate hydrolase [Micromonospora kangleipakensis]|uniref:2-hydroxy-6-oxonona-2,4-dienedioate hydrolase/4,5:9,10-diseco-3-hydroxy-5,9, 17-trioxoandrosta-1(10),2-diene-4-oate hydrolase n=1 Tax=Micromonospora kangleipakensis TaxID=1077942 RepID=A0A4Q8BBD1_9ACTN|nr:alpha/beta fold hydrolase [Micromonospora kangleipakensis]RZU74403.1 2-hydroxy-6-oxonona-2,4-dienedioate hydrolase/4,5:9,10-diseco-3-hydroxy-5,9,17-trioxoandrosta-1(10),2-diene-4-oate hydrolase [Micromonospora kangleipakensis]
MSVEEVTADQRVVRVGARDIAVTERGAGEAVVLLHGGGPGASGMSNYARNVDALAQRFRVIVPDLPGYGRSSKHIDQSDPFGDLAGAVRGLLDALGIDRAHLVGNSYGGAAALRLTLDRPDRVGRLVLMGPGGIGTTRRPPTPGLKRLLAYYGGEGPTRAKLERFIRADLVYDGTAVPAEMIEERYQASIDPEVVANPPLRRPAGLRTLLRMDLLRDKRLSGAATPTLVLWGADDKVNRPSGGLLLAERMPRCDQYLVARTGHWVQWERPDLFNSLTAAFLSEEST